MKKALYGLRQAPRAWYDRLKLFLIDNGFVIGKLDPTLFIKRKRNDQILVQLYVDDIIFGVTNENFARNFLSV